MTLKPIDWTEFENFSLEEFKSSFDSDFYVAPEIDLLILLQKVRSKLKKRIILTDGPRTVTQHIKTYKSLDKRELLSGKKWFEAIPWGSRHLPKFNCGLRAVDLKCTDCVGKDGVTIYLTGEELKDIFRDEAKYMGLYTGIGVGKRYIHLDVDREQDTTWYYSY